MILEARERSALERGAGHRLGAVGAGRARPPAGACSRPGRREAQEVRRREDRVHRLPASCGSGSNRVAACMATPEQAPTHKLSNRQQEQLLREQLHQPAARARVARHPSQLHTVVAEHRLAAERRAGHLRAAAPVDAGRPARQHRLQERRRGVVPRRTRHQVLPPPRRAPEKKPGRWIVAAELVETTRLFGRGIANIEPQWIPSRWPATC